MAIHAKSMHFCKREMAGLRQTGACWPTHVKEFRLSEINSLSSKIVLDSVRSNRYIPAYSTIGSQFQHRRQQVLQAHEDDVGAEGKYVANAEGGRCPRVNWMQWQGNPPITRWAQLQLRRHRIPYSFNVGKIRPGRTRKSCLPT